jgi:hypothetical protein
MTMRLGSSISTRVTRIARLLLAGLVVGALCGCAAGTTPRVSGGGTQNGVSASATVTGVQF